MLDLVSQTEETLGPVDIIVCCAGVMYYTMMKNLHADEWERMVDVNCKVNFRSLDFTSFCKYLTYQRFLADFVAFMMNIWT